MCLRIIAIHKLYSIHYIQYQVLLILNVQFTTAH